ncbi:MAG: RecX family transcriptional regulator [Oscillospiraceae bacterium]
MRITDITKTKKGFNALFTQDGFLFSVGDMLLYQENIKIGSCFSEQELDCLMQKSQTAKAVEKAYSLLSYRMHSRKELYDKLRKFYEQDCALFAVDKMEGLGLVNDRVFAQLKGEYLLNVKKTSLCHIKLKLQSLGIDKEIIEEVISDFEIDSQSQDILRLLKSKYASKLETPQKVIQSLMRKGFKYSDIKQAFEELHLSVDEDFQTDYNEE